MGINPSTACAYRKKFLPDLPKSAGGRPSSLSEKDVRRARRLVRSGEAENAVQVRRILGDAREKGKSPCVQTYRNCLKGAGLKASAVGRKGKVGKENKRSC